MKYSYTTPSPVAFDDILMEIFTNNDEDCLTVWDGRKHRLIFGGIYRQPASIRKLLKSFNAENVTTVRILK